MTKKARPLPGQEYESPKLLPPVENVIQELPPTSTEPLTVPNEPTGNSADPAPPVEQPVEEAANGV